MQFAGMEAERFCMNDGMGVDEDAQNWLILCDFGPFLRGKPLKFVYLRAEAEFGRSLRPGQFRGAVASAFRVRRR